MRKIILHPMVTQKVLFMVNQFAVGKLPVIQMFFLLI